MTNDQEEKRDFVLKERAAWAVKGAQALNLVRVAESLTILGRETSHLPSQSFSFPHLLKEYDNVVRDNVAKHGT